MKIKEAMLIWNEDTKDVVVASKNEKRTDLDGYFFSTGACWTEWHDMTTEEQMIVFLVAALKHSTINNIPIGNFKKALLEIDEIVESFSEGGWPSCRPSVVHYVQA
jgi:hypothetical protein